MGLKRNRKYAWLLLSILFPLIFFEELEASVSWTSGIPDVGRTRRYNGAHGKIKGNNCEE